MKTRPQCLRTVLFPKGVSRKEGPEGGLVDVSLCLCDEEIVFEAKDSGRTIADHDLEYIFDPFFSPRARGSGMGLAIVERIVRGHMGRIEVDSKLGAGTTIRLVIPIRSE
jgi:signal transduction histidine kinase